MNRIFLSIAGTVVARFYLPFVVLSIFLFMQSVSYASAEHNTPASENETEKFNAGSLIMHHIGDAYDWHILDWNGHPVSIPLLVILYHEERGLSCFFSSRFEHGTAVYDGYKLEHGHVVSVDENGNVDEASTAKTWSFSITKNVVSLFFGLALMMWIFLSISKTYRQNKNTSPKGLQSLFEPIILFVRDDIAKSAIGEKKYEKFMPFLLTIFFFIWINNMLGLVPIFPGGANLTGNIAVAMVLAVLTFIITIFSGNRNYWRHIVAMPGVPKGILIILTPIEILGVFLKPFVLMVRLFANITAGHIIVLSFFSLIFIFGELNAVVGYGSSVPLILFAVFMFFLELLVGFIQAYVFTLLSAIYFGIAVEDH